MENVAFQSFFLTAMKHQNFKTVFWLTDAGFAPHCVDTQQTQRNDLEKIWYLQYGLISNTPLDKTSSSCDPHCAVETPVLQPPSRPNLQHSSLQCLGQSNLKSSFFFPHSALLFVGANDFPYCCFFFFFPDSSISFPSHTFCSSLPHCLLRLYS